MLLLLGAWLALFHFLGNSTFGQTSIFTWMYAVFTGFEDDALCLYIPLIVIGLLIWKRQTLIATPTRTWWPALALILPALLLHVAGYAIQQTRISILAFVMGLYGITGLIWGPAWLRNTFFPMFLLLFLIPISAISEGLTLPLRLLATKLAVGFSHGILGIQVFENGAQILGPDNVPLYEVVAACSGIRSLTAMLLLMLIYAWTSFHTTWKRLTLITSAIPVTILGNVLRLIIVIICGEAFSQQTALAVEQKLGFLTFGIGLAVMLSLGHWLQEPERTPETSPPTSSPPSPFPIPQTIITLLLIGITSLGVGRLQGSMHLGTPGLRMTNEPVYSTEGDLISTNTIPLPAAVLDFTSEAGGIAPSEISFLPEDTTFARRYYKNPQGEEVMLSVVLMGTNRRSIHRPQVCLTGQGWTIERSELLEIEMSRPSPYKLPVMRLTASRPFRLPSGGTQVMKAVYVYWFVADGQLSARHGQRQWWMARDLLTEGLLQRWAYVSCLAIGRPGTEEAMFNRIETFLKDSVPTFQIAPEQSTP
ncbi:MAG: exosortase C-terminal domain/associated protein EpsI [Limisphaerales bacterium]